MIPRFLAGAFLAVICAGCNRTDKDYVVLYTSQDQFYAEPILKEFTDSTGIEVRPVFDTESAKTAALAQRLRAERSHPVCDLFWSNEEMHTRLLERNGIIGPWSSAGFRTRRVVMNTNIITLDQAPQSLLDLTNALWKGRVALAYPLFGTTKSHFIALRQLWGEKLWMDWCRGLAANSAKVVDGNSLVVKLVGAGECAIGLTDSDDVVAGLRQGLPIATIAADRESIAIPSTIGFVRGAKRTESAGALSLYLARPQTIQRLIELGAIESSSVTSNLFQVDWDQALDDLETTAEFLQSVFLRS